MFINLNLPAQLLHRDINRPYISTLPSPGRTASALLAADSQWEKLLNRANTNLSDHVDSMRNLVGEFFGIDEKIGHELGTL